MLVLLAKPPLLMRLKEGKGSKTRREGKQLFSNRGIMVGTMCQYNQKACTRALGVVWGWWVRYKAGEGGGREGRREGGREAIAETERNSGEQELTWSIKVIAVYVSVSWACTCLW